MLKMIGRKIIRAIEIFRLYRNWWYPFFAYFHLIRHPEVTYTLRKGTKFTCAIKDMEAIPAINDVWFRKIYTPGRINIKNAKIVIDIGAHIGSFSVFAALNSSPDVKVYSYEPSPVNYKFLIQNIKHNGLNNIKAFQLAISGEKGKVRLYMDEKRSTFNSTTIQKGYPVEVDAITLQNILDDNAINNCDLLKMDCEGAEYEILLGAQKSDLSRIRNIALEYHDVQSCHIDDLKKHLEKHGYDVEFGPIPILYAWRRK